MKKIGRRYDKLAQATLGYVIFLIVVIAAFSAMIWMFRHKLQASYKESADTFGEGRQFGSLATSGGVAPFVFPVLPSSDSGEVPIQPPIENPDCDLELLNSLSQDALDKQQKLAVLLQEASAARAAADKSDIEARKARREATAARNEATQARQEANSARQAADAKQADCNSCNKGEWFYWFWWDCKPTCDEAESLAEEATEKEGIATEKEGIATEKEGIATEKEGMVPELKKIATEKEQESEQAAIEATAASEALQQANEACYG
jgi:hypothetical protein